VILTLHYFTVDVEEYFQVSAFEPWVQREHWDRYERRSDASVRILLDLLDEHGARGTFFVLGWLAQRSPDLVRAIATRGHEVASHGWDHRRVTDLSPRAFRDSIRTSKQVLEGLAGTLVVGFRAPSFSIIRGREWALDVLLEEGYRYDSSLFPVRRAGYGYAGGKRWPHWISRPAGRLREIPPSTVRCFGGTLPAGGGAYFRVFPYGLVRHAIRAAEQVGERATFYIHPWEIDPEQPRVAVNAATRLRHYTGLSRTLPRLIRLLREVRFTSIASDLEGS